MMYSNIKFQGGSLGVSLRVQSGITFQGPKNGSVFSVPLLTFNPISIMLYIKAITIIYLYKLGAVSNWYTIETKL